MNKNKVIALVALTVSVTVLGCLFISNQPAKNNNSEIINATRDKSSKFEIKIKDKSNDANVILDDKNVDEGFLIDVE